MTEAQPIASGIYRVREDVHGPRGVAHVRRVEDDRPHSERYTVTFYSREAEQGTLVATCWRWGMNVHTLDNVRASDTGHIVPNYDGGWQRALSIAEHAVNGE